MRLKLRDDRGWAGRLEGPSPEGADEPAPVSLLPFSAGGMAEEVGRRRKARDVEEDDEEE